MSIPRRSPLSPSPSAPRSCRAATRCARRRGTASQRSVALQPPASAARLASLCLSILCLLILSGPAPAADPKLPVYPGAEGFGVTTPAGRGGPVIKVTNLNAEGDGSLRAALEAEGPRTVVFEVGGVIDLRATRLVIADPYLTLAGQTAPDPGITLINGGLAVRTHDVLIQHIAVRPGDRGGKGVEPDGINVGGNGEPVHSVVIDHCSFTWGIDENASVSGRNPEPHDVTYARCIIAEGLSHATHSKGEHSKGTLIHDGVKRIALIGNLYAHNFRRNPYTKSDTSLLMVNNLIYNPGQLALHISQFGGRAPTATVIGNTMIPGPDTPDGLGLLSSLGGRPTVYLHDNQILGPDGRKPDLLTRNGKGEVRKWRARIKQLDTPPLTVDPLTVLEARPAMHAVLKHAGMRPAKRDPIDQRIVDSVKQGKGSIIDSQKEVGGYPDHKPTRHTLRLPDDPGGDDDGDGYTNLEEFLHEQAARLEPRPAEPTSTPAPQP